jgi:uncharacterized membrane protein YbaN (DUF454 family)
MAMQQEPKTNNETKTRQKVMQALFFGAGTVFLVLGAIFIVLPLLPTTPLLLLALACYCRSSERMTHWMLNNKYFGKYIRNYREGKGIPLKTKLFAITTLWITISISAIIILNIWIALVLFVVAAAVTIHLVRLPTYHN